MLQQSLEFSLVRMCQVLRARAPAHGRRARCDARRSWRSSATHDALTGLPNRTLILDRVKQMLARSARNESPVAALFVDLDNFKSINDTLGHGVRRRAAAGGRREARRRGAWRRRARAPGRRRVRGDLRWVSLHAGPELIAERLLEALKPPFNLAGSGSRLNVTASVGIAIGERDLGRGAAARCRHRDVPGQVGRQEPLCGVRERHAGHHPEPHGT